MKTQKSQDGITLLITLLLMGVLMGVSASLLNVTLKQFQLSGIAYLSEVAFQAANAGMECAQYNDWVNAKFDIVPSAPRDTMTCFGSQPVADAKTTPTNPGSGDEQQFQFDWGNPAMCTQISVYKYFNAAATTTITFGTATRSCPPGGVCTVIQSRGYNTTCAIKTLGTGKIVERELTQMY